MFRGGDVDKNSVGVKDTKGTYTTYWKQFNNWLHSARLLVFLKTWHIIQRRNVFLFSQLKTANKGIPIFKFLNMLEFYTWKRILEIIWSHHPHFKVFGIFEKNCLGSHGELMTKLGLWLMSYNCTSVLRDVIFPGGNLFRRKLNLNDDNIQLWILL